MSWGSFLPTICHRITSYNVCYTKLLRINYLTEDNTIKAFKVNWNGGCGRGFPKFIPLYVKAGMAKWVKIGEADALLSSMKGTLHIEIEKLKEDPSFFFCDDVTCKDFV